ncbi:MAG: hypothetical protein ISR65_01260 [Bacteriovoracaceae bacterium]|nr:hypothetical protein [Bacteriovoracaceae bacterium]
MIESMCKITLVLHNNHVDRILNSIHDMGVLHVTQKPVDVAKFAHSIKLKKRIDNFFKYVVHKHHPSIHQASYDGKLEELLTDFESMQKEVENLENETQKYVKMIHKIENWGDYSSELLDKLEEAGVFLKFYVISQKVFDGLDLGDINYQIINNRHGVLYLVTIHRTKDEEGLSFSSQNMPALGSTECHLTLRKLEDDLNKAKETLDSYITYYHYMYRELSKINDELSYLEVKDGINDHYEHISSLVGFAPQAKSAEIEKKLNEIDNIVFDIDRDIKEEDLPNVPILLKNNKFSKMFEPITKLFALPNYAEFDLTPFFAPFFVLFFGLCLSDAGYGVVVSIASLVGIFKLPKFRSFMVLGLILGLSVVFAGIIGGTFFGLDLFKTHLPLLSDLAMFPPEHMFYLALLIGLFQILFGMMVQFFNRYFQAGFLAALSSLGWAIMLIFIVFTYLGNQQASGDFTIGIALINFSKSIPLTVKYWGLSIATLLILFFNDMKVNVFIRLGKGLWELYGITGVFGDLLSYIRLFALGISSAILGTVINSIGTQLLNIDIPIVSHILFLLFIVIGHSCNLALASLGAFVHPLRLTFVEFYKNAGFAGGGKEYSPFKRYYLEKIEHR